MVYKIPGVSPEMMRLIIEYAYTRTVQITTENAESLFIAADQFNIMGIIRLCCEFFKSHLCFENCVGIYRFTEYYYCPELQEAAFTFILHHFEDITKVSEEFLDLSVSELKNIIEKDELNVREEDAVFKAIVKWIDHDSSSRRQHIAELLNKVGADAGSAGPQPLRFSCQVGGSSLSHPWAIEDPALGLGLSSQVPGSSHSTACHSQEGPKFTRDVISAHTEPLFGYEPCKQQQALGQFESGRGKPRAKAAAGSLP